MTDEQIQAARAAFKRDPETACRAMLGCSAEEMFVTALRGCNQHKHKPGCPDANGKRGDGKLQAALTGREKAAARYRENPTQENSAAYSAANRRVAKLEKQRGSGNKKHDYDVYWVYNNRDGKMEQVAESEMMDFIDDGLTTAVITSDEKGLTVEAGEDKRTFKIGSGKNAKDERERQRAFIARAFGSFDWKRNGKNTYDAEALDKVLDMAKHHKSVSLAVFGDYEDD